MSPTGKREMLRHTVATLAYRGGKAVRDVPEGFGEFNVGPGVRTPLQILSHIGDLLDWALATAKGQQVYRETLGTAWQSEVERFHRALAAFDAFLASDAELGADEERLFQGPIADALTHVGQIALVRRLAEAPVRGENYLVAEIARGQTGRAQPPPRREFD